MAPGWRAEVFAVVVVAAALGALVQEASARKAEYRMTIRDFLPANCMRRSEYQVAWGRSSADFGIRDSTYDNAATLTGTLLVNSESLDWAVFCPYWEEMRAGNISGHPDFESTGYVDGPSCTVGCDGVPDSSPTITPVVLNDLETASSGLRKLVYCLPGDEDRCGRGLADDKKDLFTTSRGKFFKSWYYDDPKYNKRVGVTIELEGNGNLVEFNSEEFCKVEQGKATCSNPKFDPLRSYVSKVAEATYRDVYPRAADAPAWPSSISGSATYPNSKFWYTTEIHTYFEFAGDEVFEFKGDDDVWVFINGRMAVDLGGLHSPKEGKVVLSDPAIQLALNITPGLGNIYRFDMFHAERHIDGSNFRITTSLSTACNVADTNANEVAFSWANVSASSFSFGGPAELLGEGDSALLRLTSNSTAFRNAATHAYLVQQQNVGTGFVTEFTFAASAEGNAQGFAFVMHNRAAGLTNMPQTTGPSLNIRYLERSVAVVFDMCVTLDPATGACEGQRVSIHYPKVDGEFNDVSNNTVTVFDTVQRTLRYPGETHLVRIEYLQSPPWLEVYIDNSLYLRDEDFDITRILGGRNAYVGFSASTTSDPVEILLSDFSINTVRVDPSKTFGLTLQPNATASEIQADGADAAEFSFQTRDFCGNLIQYGGFKSFGTGYFVEIIPELVALDEDGVAPDSRLLAELDELTYFGGALEPAIVPAEIVDNGDGSYAARLATDLPGAFALYVCFGKGGCNFSISFEDAEVVFPGSNFTQGLTWAVLSASATAEYVGTVRNAVGVVALTNRPTTSPTASIPPPEPDNAETIKWAAVGGGSAFFVFLCISFIVLRNRRRWRKDKAFIESGKLYNIDKDVTYDKADEYGVVGRMLLSTRAAIMRERAQTVKAPLATEINALVTENEELKEQVRVNKMHTQVSATLASAPARPDASKPRRKEYNGDDHESL